MIVRLVGHTQPDTQVISEVIGVRPEPNDSTAGAWLRLMGAGLPGVNFRRSYHIEFYLDGDLRWIAEITNNGCPPHALSIETLDMRAVALIDMNLEQWEEALETLCDKDNNLELRAIGNEIFRQIAALLPDIFRDVQKVGLEDGTWHLKR